jgi:hypothetical protein
MTELMQRYPMEILREPLQVATIGIPNKCFIKNNIRFDEISLPRRQEGDGKHSAAEALSINRIGHRHRRVPIGAGRRQDGAPIDRKLHVGQMLVPEIQRILG